MDRNVEAVCSKHRIRAEKGLQKYGVDTTRTDLSLTDWLVHLQEELMDAAVYAERLLCSIKETEQTEQLQAEIEYQLAVDRRIMWKEKHFNDVTAAKKSGYEEGRAEVERLQGQIARLEVKVTQLIDERDHWKYRREASETVGGE